MNYRTTARQEHTRELPTVNKDYGFLTDSYKKNLSDRWQKETAARNREAQFRHLFEEITCGLLVCDVIFDASGRPCDYEFVCGNAAFEQLTGFSAKDLAGKSGREIDSGWPGDLVQKCYTVALTGEAIKYERFNEARGRYYETRVFSPRYGQFAHAFTDITAHKQAEAELQRVNKELEKRKIEHINQLNTTNKELEAFSYTVSHDLHAPLRRIAGFTEMLAEDYSGQLDAEGNRICSVIKDNCLQMGQLIDNLLSFSRFNNAEMHHSPLDMKMMALAAFNEVTDHLPQERLSLSIGTMSNVQGDQNLMRQVWINLLSNAVKYSGKKEKAIISISCREEQGKCIYCVEDNGAGFDMENADKLFKVFKRLHSSKDFEGNGIGLAIVQHIIVRHGGSVWAEGETGKGARFYFSLPPIAMGIHEN